MRLLLFLILTLTFATLSAQNKVLDYQVSLSRRVQTVGQTISEIEAQARVIFAYSNDLAVDRELDFGRTRGRIADFLAVMERETGFAHSVKRKKILLFRKEESPDAPEPPPPTKNTFTLSGYLRDGENGEDLIYGSVRIAEAGKEPLGGVYSNEYGFYSLTIPAGEYVVTFSYLGFEPQAVRINLDRDQRRNIELRMREVEIEAVEIKEDPHDARLDATEVGMMTVNMDELKAIPVVMGEKDVLKSISLMPGISGANEGSGNMYVRGGNSDQNLLLLDEAPVYNPAHLLGFFSIFNSDALRDVQVFKGGIPAQYGGRSSSVVDIRMKEGNRKKLSGSGGIGIVASRVALEGPFAKGKGSFLLSGRRTYLDLLTRFSPVPAVRDGRFFFYDINGKVNYSLGERNRFFLSFYSGRDVLASSEVPVGLNWGNNTLTMRWNHLFTDRVFSNTSLIFSDYNYVFDLDVDGVNYSLGSGISNVNFKEDITWFVNERNTVRMGFNTIAHVFKAGELRIARPNSSVERFAIGERQALESAVYAGDDRLISDRLRLNYGARLSFFQLIGPATVYEFADNGEPTDTLQYSAFQNYKNYLGLAPRFAASYRLSETQSLKFAYSRLFQYIHKLSSTSASLPTDYWIPSSEIVRPQRTDQFSLSYLHNLLDGKLETSAEAFYKTMANQIDYRDGASLFFNDQFESELVFGRGRSYGIEILLRKPGGRLHGWLSYTLLRSLRQFDDINNGQWFSARQDRIHDVALVLGYDINDRLEANLNWVFATGDAVTFPSGKYEIDGNVVTYYTERNGYRFPPYHRMDLGLTWQASSSEKFRHDLNFCIYNLYARRNPFIYQFRDNANAPGQLEVVKISLFTIVPSITWNFEF